MITIIGAGLGGLTLANILHRNGVDVQVFERDQSPDDRRQGGMLDLHEDSGQAALRAAGLFEEFQSLVLEGADGQRVLDKTGKLCLDQPGTGARPEVERGDLRRLLLSALPREGVHWGAKAFEIEPCGAGSYEVWFDDGRIVTTDLLVGADGARSVVRPLLSKVAPVYTGVSMVETRIHDVPRSHPEFAALVGRGSLFALSDGRGILAHCEPDGVICVYAALPVPAHWGATALVTRGSVLEFFRDWDPAFRGLIKESDEELRVRPIYALPTGHRWDSRPGLTLIGDAAHLMSPFAGEGANQAMQDGAELAQAILDYPGDVAAALAQFEPPMFARSQEAAAASAAGQAMCLGSTAPKELVGFFGGHRSPIKV